ncbi:MAG: hypothetical protein HXX80_07450 [Nitrososphaerales archaeon]|nr:hypothetical protein [Nitrososphaerales archaeon]
MTPKITTSDTLRGELPISPSDNEKGKSPNKDVDFLSDVESSDEITRINGSIQFDKDSNGQILVLDQDSPLRVHLPMDRVSAKSKWSYARLVMGRQVADKIYKEILEEVEANKEKYKITPLNRPSKVAVGRLFMRSLGTNDSRPLQILVHKGEIKCIASSDVHSLISKDQVMGIIRQAFVDERVFNFMGPAQKAFKGQIAIGLTEKVMTEFGSWNLGLAVNTGDLLTNRAIKVGSFIMVEACTNPVTWLNGSGWTDPRRNAKFDLDRINLIQDRVLRWTDKTEVSERIKEAIQEVRGGSKGLVDLVTENGKQKLSLHEARTIIDAIFTSYHLGEKLQKFVVDEYDKVPVDHKNVYELAMITSNLAINPEAPISERGQYVRQHLSTISAIMLSYKNVQNLIEKCDERVKGRLVPR